MRHTLQTLAVGAALILGALTILQLCGCETWGDYPGCYHTEHDACLWAPIPLEVEPIGDVPRLEEAADFWSCVNVGANGIATVEVGMVPGGDWGVAHIEADRITGEIWSCDIVVSWDIAYDHDTVERVIVHELGHCRGLDDDPGVESIMASPPGWILRSEDAAHACTGAP